MVVLKISVKFHFEEMSGMDLQWSAVLRQAKLLHWTNPSFNIFQPDILLNNLTVGISKQVCSKKADERSSTEDTCYRKMPESHTRSKLCSEKKLFIVLFCALNSGSTSWDCVQATLNVNFFSQKPGYCCLLCVLYSCMLKNSLALSF